jgi:ABC-2 type transport system ATP-binding protein
VLTFRLPAGATAADLPDLGGRPVGDGRELQVTTRTPTAVLHRLTGWAAERGIELPSLTVTRPSLEDVYLDLVAAHGTRSAPAEPRREGVTA